MVSPGFVKLTGYQPSEAIGRNCRFLQRHRGRPLTFLREAIKSRQRACELILNYKKDGTPFYCLVNVIPLFDSKGELKCKHSFFTHQPRCQSINLYSQPCLFNCASACGETDGLDLKSGLVHRW